MLIGERISGVGLENNITAINKFAILDSPYFNIILFIEIWCNGSTMDFGSISSGSNPDISTNHYLIDNVFIDNSVLMGKGGLD